MKPAPFEYYAPSSLPDAVDLLARLDADGCDMKILAGGQSLMPMLALRVARPEALVDLRRLEGLNYIRSEDDGTLAIGAMTSKQAAADSPSVRGVQPLFQAATELVGHRQIRNRGSVGGSFAHADPASEYPAVALVLDTDFDAIGPDGPRRIPAADFFVTYMTTALEPTEILTAVGGGGGAPRGGGGGGPRGGPPPPRAGGGGGPPPPRDRHRRALRAFPIRTLLGDPGVRAPQRRSRARRRSPHLRHRSRPVLRRAYRGLRRRGDRRPPHCGRATARRTPRAADRLRGRGQGRSGGA